MRGYPKFLSTKSDYEYVRQHFPKEQWQSDFQALLDTRYDWFFVKELAKGEIGISDDTHKVEIDSGFNGEETKNYQYELRYNPNCKLVQIGYTEEEIKAYLA